MTSIEEVHKDVDGRAAYELVQMTKALSRAVSGDEDPRALLFFAVAIASVHGHVFEDRTASIIKLIEDSSRFVSEWIAGRCKDCTEREKQPAPEPITLVPGPTIPQ